MVTRINGITYSDIPVSFSPSVTILKAVKLDRKLTAGCSRMKNHVCRCSQVLANASRRWLASHTQVTRRCPQVPQWALSLAGVSQVSRRCILSVSQPPRRWASMHATRLCTRMFFNFDSVWKVIEGEWWSRNFSAVKISGLISFPSIYRSSEWFLWVCPNSNVKLLNLIQVFKGIFQTHV